MAGKRGEAPGGKQGRPTNFDWAGSFMYHIGANFSSCDKGMAMMPVHNHAVYASRDSRSKKPTTGFAQRSGAQEPRSGDGTILGPSAVDLLHRSPKDQE